MEFLLAAFGMPIFAAMAVIIESHLSNRTFKHPATMVFYVSISNALFLPLLLFLGTPTMPSPDRKSTRLNSSHMPKSRMPSSA